MKTYVVYSLEAPQQGVSNGYLQYMFSQRNKKNIMWMDTPLSGGINKYLEVVKNKSCQKTMQLDGKG